MRVLVSFLVWVPRTPVDSFKRKKIVDFTDRLSVGCLSFPCSRENYEVSHEGREIGAGGCDMSSTWHGSNTPEVPGRLLKGKHKSFEFRHKEGCLEAVHRWTRMAR